MQIQFHSQGVNVWNMLLHLQVCKHIFCICLQTAHSVDGNAMTQCCIYEAKLYEEPR